MTTLDITNCDREPIHTPGAIQPHGMLLVLDRDLLTVLHVAGDVEARLGVADWLGRSAGELIGDPLAQRISRMSDSTAAGAFVGQLATSGGQALDVTAHPTGDVIIVELEPATAVPAPDSSVMSLLDLAGGAFERASNLKALCERAAVEFRRLTGFDRVLIYRFSEEGGAVLGEDRSPDLPSFLNHHFPGSDVPMQARALYVRNLVRVIPDVNYVPAPLRPAWTGPAPLDMSDCALRSVAPVHMQYLHNMGVAASASVSIVRDGQLWGLVACHSIRPRLLPYDVRVACRLLAGGLARQVRAKEDAAAWRERIRVRGFEDDFAAYLARSTSIDEAISSSLPDLMQMLNADGVAAVRGGEIRTYGACPAESDIRTLSGWVVSRAELEPFATDRLSQILPESRAFAARASGLVAVTISSEEPFVLLWFRAEHVEVIEWAGNPHKAVDADNPSQPLSPRASFEAWSETVRGRARRWTATEVEGAGRLRRVLLDARQARRLRELNERLSETVADKESLLQQKEYLLREVNHRVQNSLQLVSSFLALQARASEDETSKAHLTEAQRRLSAVALVHRRLYRADQVETIDLARYIEELTEEMLSSMGPEWRDKLELDIAPVSISADRAVTLGLVLTELVINANKYAYDGRAGPVDVCLDQDGSDFRLSVADRGRGKHEPRQGFGTRMMAAMVEQLGGRIDYRNNDPGLRAVLTAPLVLR